MPLPPRHNVFVSLSREERRQLEKLAAAEVRTVGNYVTRLVLAV